MAKFKNLHLLLQEDQKIYFGPDTLSPTIPPHTDYGDALNYPVTVTGTKPFMTYTTISGYNTTLPGAGVTNISAVDELVVSAPVAGERAVELYHLVRYDQLIALSGTLTDHGALNGLDDDDHPHYILVDGTRGFTGTVSGINPTESYHLTTKWYVDEYFPTFSGNNIFTGDNLFEGPTTFSGVVNLGDDLFFGDNTISGTGDIYGDIYDIKRKYGRETCVYKARDQAVVFDNPYPNDDYILLATLTNEVDSDPSIYSTIQGVKTAGGFTTHFSGKLDSSNFILEWVAFYGPDYH